MFQTAVEMGFGKMVSWRNTLTVSKTTNVAREVFTEYGHSEGTEY